jgi:acetolactate synthase-1/3 small subunit
MTGGPTHAPEVPEFVTADGHKTHDHVESKFERERAIAQNFEKSGSSLPSNLSSYSSNGQHNPLGASEALIAKHLHLRSVKTLTEQFGGRVVDVAENSVIIELTAKSARVEAFLSLMRPFGVLEAVRSGKSKVGTMCPIVKLKSLVTGLMVLPRTPIARSPYDDEEISESGAAMDASLLPPG